MSGKSIHSWVLNHKGMMVHSQTPVEAINIEYGDSDYSWDEFLFDIFAGSIENPGERAMNTELVNVELGNEYRFNPRAFVFKQWYEGDLFVIASPVGTEMSAMEEELNSLMILRKAMKDRFLGLLFCDWLDEQGPVPAYNNSPVDDEVTAMQLAAQGLSMAAMGQGNIPDHVVGPIPVPNCPNYQTLIYSFARPSDSEDPRIQVSGRPGVLFLIFRLEKIAAEILEFIEGVLYQWKADPDVSDRGLDDLTENLRLTITFATDLVKSKEEQYRQLISKYHAELLFLRQENQQLKLELRRLKSKKRPGRKRKPGRKKKSESKKSSVTKEEKELSNCGD